MPKSLNILHLEDNLTDAHLVADMLDSEGYKCNVIVVDTETEFSEAVKEPQWDFIFADYTLPAFDAMRALDIAKEMAPEVPFILISGTIGEEIAIDSLKAGADDYVLKTRLSRLVHAVRRSLKEKEEIKKRKEAEQKAIDQSKLLSEVVGHALDAVIMIDEKDQIRIFNEAAEKMFRYSAIEVENKNIKLIIPDLFSGGAASVEENGITDSRSIHTIYLEGVQKNGTILQLEVSLSPVSLAGKDFHAIIARDITYRLQVEKELKEAKDQLEEKVKARTAELDRSNKQLEKFAFLVSHDLREPLRMVASFLKLLRKEASSKLNNTELEFLDFAEEGTIRMKSLFDGILEYSRIDPKANFEKIDLNRLLILVRSNLKKAIDEKQATLEIESDLPNISGNRVQITQLFQNLISNALKFAREGIPPVIKIGHCREGRLFKFFVKDNGIGIHPDDFHKIFHIFQRVYKRDKYPGSGIGLAICKDIIVIHGGEISVQSEPGIGTTFVFTIPE